MHRAGSPQLHAAAVLLAAPPHAHRVQLLQPSSPLHCHTEAPTPLRNVGSGAHAQPCRLPQGSSSLSLGSSILAALHGNGQQGMIALMRAHARGPRWPGPGLARTLLLLLAAWQAPATRLQALMSPRAGRPRFTATSAHKGAAASTPTHCAGTGGGLCGGLAVAWQCRRLTNAARQGRRCPAAAMQGRLRMANASAGNSTQQPSPGPPKLVCHVQPGRGAVHVGAAPHRRWPARC